MVEEIFECVPSRMKDLNTSKKVPSGNPCPGWYNFKIKIWWSLEQAKVPRYKLIVAPIAKRDGKFNVLLCDEISSPNANERIS